jgi:glycosyltransferase involved in cell wall biosynthesis
VTHLLKSQAVDPVILGVTLVSVCIPAYNRSEFIGEAIESALAQTYQPLEVVVVDDASTDRTVDRVRAYSDPRVRLVVNERRLGQNRNRNRALSLGSGRLIKFLDSDDWLRADCVEQMVEVFARDPEVGIVFCPRHIASSGADADDAWAARYGEVHTHFSRLDVVNDGQRLLSEWVAGGVSSNWVGEPTAVMVSRAHVEQAGGFSTHIRQSMDADLWIRLLSRSRVGFVPDKLVYHRVGHVAARTHNNRTRVNWLDQLWRLEGLVRDDEIRARFPQLADYLKAERRQAWRTAARFGYPPGARRVPLRPYFAYLRYRACAALGYAEPLYETLPTLDGRHPTAGRRA